MKSCKGCKHYKKDERTRLIICEFDLHERYCEKDKEDFAIEELEKLKTKMEVIHNRYAINFQSYSMSVAKECIDIIDKRIAELKGEDNA